MNDVPNSNMQEFCSQKLWALVSDASTATTPDEMQAAIDELAKRRHYLRELETLGKLSIRP